MKLRLPKPKSPITHRDFKPANDGWKDNTVYRLFDGEALGKTPPRSVKLTLSNLEIVVHRGFDDRWCYSCRELYTMSHLLKSMRLVDAKQEAVVAVREKVKQMDECLAHYVLKPKLKLR